MNACQRVGVVAELRGPIRVRTPGRAFEHDTDAVRAGDLRVAREVALEDRFVLRAIEEDECREVLMSSSLTTMSNDQSAPAVVARRGAANGRDGVDTSRNRSM